MNFIKKIINFIKSLLPKLNKQIDIPQEIKIEKNIDEFSNIIKEIQFCDIIWAKRYKNQIEKDCIKEGHREGPFLVLGKINDKLICSKGTSVVPSKKSSKNYFDLKNNEYNLDKETYFKLRDLTTIDNYSFIRFLDSLMIEDKIEVIRTIKKLKNNTYDLNEEKVKFELPLSSGDIIRYNNINYIIIDTNEDKFTCIRVSVSLNTLRDDLKFEYLKNLDYSKLVIIETKEELEFVNTLDNNMLVYILKKQNEYIENCKNKKVTQRGSVILKDNKYYYVYGEEAQEWLIFRVYKESKLNKDYILINNKKYYTNYEDIRINKKENFETIVLATNQEVDDIKAKRKSHKKEKTFVGNFDIGTIVEYGNSSKNRYIIIKKCKKTYECLEIEKIKQGIYDPILLLKTNVKLSNNKSIDGIIWLEENPEFDLKYIYQENIIKEILKAQRKYNSVNSEIINNFLKDSKQKIKHKYL